MNLTSTGYEPYCYSRAQAKYFDKQSSSAREWGVKEALALVTNAVMGQQRHLARAAQVLATSVDCEGKDTEGHINEDCVDVAGKESGFESSSSSIDAHRDGNEECSLHAKHITPSEKHWPFNELR